MRATIAAAAARWRERSSGLATVKGEVRLAVRVPEDPKLL
jgi:hypothetical protein